MDVWRERDLSGTAYRFLFLDGANFQVRRGRTVERLRFLCVVGARARDGGMEVLAIEVGDREQKTLWAALFQTLARRGLDMTAVELGIMDGLPGLEAAFRAAYPSAVQIIERDLESLLRFYRWEPSYWHSLRTTDPIERVNKEFKRRTKAMGITGRELTTYRLLAYVALTMNLAWRSYALSTPRHFYTLKAA